MPLVTMAPDRHAAEELAAEGPDVAIMPDAVFDSIARWRRLVLASKLHSIFRVVCDFYLLCGQGFEGFDITRHPYSDLAFAIMPDLSKDVCHTRMTLCIRRARTLTQEQAPD